MKTYDAILSLGSWCQTGGVMWDYGLKSVNSPFDNFGIKVWQNLMEVLDRDFEGYWQRENMVIGKAAIYASLRKGKDALVYKVYDDRYNMISTHNFDEDMNGPSALSTFDDFREQLDKLIKVFRYQCHNYESVLFTCKALDHPPEATKASPEDIDRLLSSLNRYRQGKPFDLRLAVPMKDLEACTAHVGALRLGSRVKITGWTTVWNTQPGAEWDEVYGDVQVAPGQFLRVRDQILACTSLDLDEANRLCAFSRHSPGADVTDRVGLKIADNEGPRPALSAKGDLRFVPGASAGGMAVEVEVPAEEGWRQGLLVAKDFVGLDRLDFKRVAGIEFDLNCSEDLLDASTWSQMDLVVQAPMADWLTLPVFQNTGMRAGVWTKFTLHFNATAFPQGLGGLWSLQFVFNSGQKVGGSFSIDNVDLLMRA